NEGRSGGVLGAGPRSKMKKHVVKVGGRMKFLPWP
ncbi:hypothetical protein A2U01_0097045, partial [Trifolium medium]|nr:hypothetical protein [Trifolium medium]